MAARLQVGFLLIFCASSFAQFSRLSEEMQRYTLCARKGPNRQCVPGSVCPAGTEVVRPRNYLMCMGPGYVCCQQTATNECQNGAANCVCRNQGFTCTCDPGFTGNGLICLDNNECIGTRLVCPFGQTCYNTLGSFLCCPSGEEAVNGVCRDINECVTSVCSPNQVCYNTPGSYVCCAAGHEFVNGVCRDIDECRLRPCGTSETCVNTPGSFECCTSTQIVVNGGCQDRPTPPPSINYPGCGELSPQARLAFGEDELECQSPWQASLRRLLIPNTQPSIGNSIHVAGGVLVGESWVLSTPLAVLFAGRSIQGESFQDNMFVALGDYNHRDSSGQEQLRRVRNVFFHSGASFDVSADFSNVYVTSQESEWQANAFALIQLDSPVDLTTPCVTPVCLPTSRACSNVEVCKVTGWGADENEQLQDNLQKADVSLFEGRACEAISRNGTMPEKVGCAINNRGTFACVGDFGGPVVCEGGTPAAKRTVEGLAVTRLDCNNNNVPMRVALVCEAMDWIESTIRRFS